jgi:hypothetical protein
MRKRGVQQTSGTGGFGKEIFKNGKSSRKKIYM